MRCLHVEHVIVMSHARRGGIRALLGYDPATGGFELFVRAVAGQPASQHTTLE